MDPLTLTLEQHEALYAQARRRAQALREQAIADAIGAAASWLRRRIVRQSHPKEAACHS